MKTKLALFVTLFGLSLWTNAQQSPDRHKCFGLATVASQPVDGDIPVEYCIEAISVNTEDNEITVSTKITPEVFSDMKINSILRSGDGKIRFYASKELHNEWDAECGEGQIVTLVITGQTDARGRVSMNDNFRIITDEKVTTDTCKVQPTFSSYRYIMK
jgi:hypothetical protein